MKSPSYTSPDRTYTEWRNHGFSATTTDGDILIWDNDVEIVSISEGWQSAEVDYLDIYSAETAFSALRSDGTAVSWGEGIGDEPILIDLVDDKIVDISGGTWGFAGVTSSGGLYTWGNNEDPGYKLNNGVEKVFSGSSTFAALLDDGSVYSINQWGIGIDDGWS